MDQFGSRYGSFGSGTRVIPSGTTARPAAHTSQIPRPAPSQTPQTETYDIGRYLDQTGKQAGARTSNPGGITGRALTLYCQGFLNGTPTRSNPDDSTSPWTLAFTLGEIRSAVERHNEQRRREREAAITA